MWGLNFNSFLPSTNDDSARGASNHSTNETAKDPNIVRITRLPKVEIQLEIMSGVKGKDKMDCIICQLVNEEIEVTKVYEDDSVVAVMDIQPFNTGHLFISPKKHVEFMSELDEELGAHMFKIAMKLVDALRKSELKCEGVNLFLADGEVAGQEVPHVHLHVIPRIRGDGFGLRFDESYFDLPEREELEQAASSIKVAIE